MKFGDCRLIEFPTTMISLSVGHISNRRHIVGGCDLAVVLASDVSIFGTRLPFLW